MTNKKGLIDQDLGLQEILKEMGKLKDMRVKVGIPEDAKKSNGLHIATYATYNELGVKNKGGGWFIPPRPFMRNTADGKREKIQEAIDKNIGRVQQGKTDAKTALGLLGEAVVTLTNDTIREGPWEPNSKITINGLRQKDGRRYVKGKDGKPLIKGKKSTKPLIHTGAMIESIQYIIEQNGKEIARGK
jgi:hypothetical protein